MLTNDVLNSIFGGFQQLFDWLFTHNAVDCTINNVRYTLTWFDALVSLFIIGVLCDVVLRFIRRGQGGDSDD